MISFRLCVHEIIEGASDRIARKEVEWPVVPRFGEEVWILGNYHEVSLLRHGMDQPDGCVEVCFEFDSVDFEVLVNDPKWAIFPA